MTKRVLLLEPNYCNKYPPMGLMKLATYHRLQKDWEVVFYKGDLKKFVVEEYTREAIRDLTKIAPRFPWKTNVSAIEKYIKTGKHDLNSQCYKLWNDELHYFSDDEIMKIRNFLEKYRQFYRTKDYFKRPRWDRVCVTTLFTFYWKITVETIEFAKKIVKKPYDKTLMVGGIMATVVADELEKTTKVKPFKGCINACNIFDDKPLDIPVDELSLDYSILDEIDYKYPCVDAYYGYMTRGCVNKCPFCAVPKLEPEYKDYIPLKQRIDETKKRFGEQRNLLLLDNNVFASRRFYEIIDEIKDCGFAKGAKYIPPNPWQILIGRLEDGWNERAAIRQTIKLLMETVESCKDKFSRDMYSYLIANRLCNEHTAPKGGLISACRVMAQRFDQCRKLPRIRHVDFNQGLDARLATEEKVKKLSEIAIHPLRIAFDSWQLREHYLRAVCLAAKYDIRSMSNYLLYNFQDEPIELYRRLLLNVDLALELDVNIYSFPMKYHPIYDSQWFANRHYLGTYWNRKKIRTIQVVLNSTKGKVGRGRTFFFKAFGKNENEFEELLQMPEALVVKRWDAEIAGLTEQWRNFRKKLSTQELEMAETIVGTNVFEPENWKHFPENVRRYLNFYLVSENEIPTASYSQKQQAIKSFEAMCPTEVSVECRRLLDSYNTK